MLKEFHIALDEKRNGELIHYFTVVNAPDRGTVLETIKSTNDFRKKNGLPHMFHVKVARSMDCGERTYIFPLWINNPLRYRRDGQKGYGMDLISRQAAIAVADYSDCVVLSVDDVKKVTDEVVKGLKRLPSAEPEIIKCKDCKYRIVNVNYGKKGYLNLKAVRDLDTGDPFELGRRAEDDEWFCADAERKDND